MANDSTGMIRVEEGWKELLSEIRSFPGKRTVYVAGASDRGKTTFSQYLSEALAVDQPTASIDCDPGQSSIGPPACIGMHQVAASGLAVGPPVLSFVGSLSPTGHLLQNLCGAKKLFDKALAAGCGAVVIDSSGFVMGDIAREFQFNVIDLIRPAFLVAFERDDELEPLLRNFEGSSDIHIWRMPVPCAVRERSPLARQAHRTERFRQYFRDAETRRVRISGKGLHGAVPDFREPGTYENLLIALCGPENFVSALALVRAYSPKGKALEVFAPPFDGRGVSTIQFGSLYLDEDFRTVPRLYHS